MWKSARRLSWAASCTGWMMLAGLAGAVDGAVQTYPLEVLPAEYRHEVDPDTGAALTWLTTDPGSDTNLYYHARSWLADGSLILFTSEREDGGLMGYLTATGELVRFSTAAGPLTGATAAAAKNSVYGVRDGHAVEVVLEVTPSDDPASRPSQVTATERMICALPASRQGIELRENIDGAWLAFRVNETEDAGPRIYTIDTVSGALHMLLALPAAAGPIAHVQWSRTTPHLLSFNNMMHGETFTPARSASEGPQDYLNRSQRLWVVDVRDPVPQNIYEALEGELVTHVVWWVDDQMIFCGDVQTDTSIGDASHVKAIDVHSGVVRVLGAGSWWPAGPRSEIARRNWWHASGSDDGRWIVADNWHGDLVLFEGKNTRPHLLTQGHRTFGSGTHPHPGWDRKGEQVIFGSDKLGAPNVCIATVPEALQALVAENTDGLDWQAPWPREHRAVQAADADAEPREKIVARGPVLVEEDFENLDNWHLEGHVEGVSQPEPGVLRLDCTGSQQGGIGVHAFYKEDLPDNIAIEYTMYAESNNGLLITFFAMQGVGGEDALTELPPREGRFRNYTGSPPEHPHVPRSYHVSLSRYDDEGNHTGVSNWRRNPGLHLVGQGPDPCEEIERAYRVTIIKQGPRCQLQVDGEVISEFVDTLDPAEHGPIPTAGKIGFRAIGAKAIFRIQDFRVTALE